MKPAPLADVDRPRKYFLDHLDTYTPTGYKRSKNKYIATHVRDGIAQTFDHLGGWAGLAAWAKDNPDLFYSRVLPMVLPKAQLDGLGGGGVTLVIQSFSTPIMPRGEPLTISTSVTPEPPSDTPMESIPAQFT